MREIKFRAWDKKDEMMYCDIQKGIEFTDLSHYDFDEFLGNPKGMGDYHEWEVMQYTGLKDKNGKEIYEGDIVFNHSVSVKKSGPVKFSDIHHAYIIDYPRTHKDNWEFMHGSEHNLEIIGNIYENKDLLKGQHEDTKTKKNRMG